MRLRRPSKAQRRAALAAYLDGLPDPPELPPEAEGISMVEDGAVLVGNGWTLPSDYADDEIRRGELASLKGITPVELPMLNDDHTNNT